MQLISQSGYPKEWSHNGGFVRQENKVAPFVALVFADEDSTDLEVIGTVQKRSDAERLLDRHGFTTYQVVAAESPKTSVLYEHHSFEQAIAWRDSNAPLAGIWALQQVQAPNHALALELDAAPPIRL
jgi:hypothetical protein